MIGHKALLELRKSGMKPLHVWICCLLEQPAYGRYTHPENQIEYFGLNQYRGNPTIHVFDDESASSLDLRAVIGTVVHISADTRQRGMAVLEQVAKFSPSKAIAAGDWGMVGYKPDRGMVEFRV